MEKVIDLLRFVQHCSKGMGALSCIITKDFSNAITRDEKAVLVQRLRCHGNRDVSEKQFHLSSAQMTLSVFYSPLDVSNTQTNVNYFEDSIGNAAVWIGEIYDHSISFPSINDVSIPQWIVQNASQFTSVSGIASFLANMSVTLTGQFSLVFWHQGFQTMFFGHDSRGMHSMVWTKPLLTQTFQNQLNSSGECFIVSTIPVATICIEKNMALRDAYEELPPMGIFSIGYSNNTAKNAELCSYFESDKLSEENEPELIGYFEQLECYLFAWPKNRLSSLGEEGSIPLPPSTSLEAFPIAPVEELKDVVLTFLSYLSLAVKQRVQTPVETFTNTSAPTPTPTMSNKVSLDPSLFVFLPSEGRIFTEPPKVTRVLQALHENGFTITDLPPLGSIMSLSTSGNCSMPSGAIDVNPSLGTTGAKIAILFSGGLDSMLCARLCHEHRPVDEPIDLLNVCFAGDGTSPDRFAALEGIRQLEHACPGRKWNLIRIDECYRSLVAEHFHTIMHLATPQQTHMDFNIGTCLWTASRGIGFVEVPVTQLSSEILASSKALRDAANTAAECEVASIEQSNVRKLGSTRLRYAMHTIPVPEGSQATLRDFQALDEATSDDMAKEALKSHYQEGPDYLRKQRMYLQAHLEELSLPSENVSPAKGDIPPSQDPLQYAHGRIKDSVTRDQLDQALLGADDPLQLYPILIGEGRSSADGGQKSQNIVNSLEQCAEKRMEALRKIHSESLQAKISSLHKFWETNNKEVNASTADTRTGSNFSDQKVSGANIRINPVPCVPVIKKGTSKKADGEISMKCRGKEILGIVPSECRNVVNAKCLRVLCKKCCVLLTRKENIPCDIHALRGKMAEKAQRKMLLEQQREINKGEAEQGEEPVANEQEQSRAMGNEFLTSKIAANSLSTLERHNLPTHVRVLVRSSAQILLSGLGADEIAGGYGRHRTAFSVRGWQGLHAEMRFDVARLWKRNFGRDTRMCSAHGKSVRFPFLDERVTAFVSQLPPPLVYDLRLAHGVGDKRLIRIAAALVDLSSCSVLVKRAIQFGSRIAKQSNNLTSESNRSSSGTHDMTLPENLFAKEDKVYDE